MPVIILFVFTALVSAFTSVVLIWPAYGLWALALAPFFASIAMLIVAIAGVSSPAEHDVLRSTRGLV